MQSHFWNNIKIHNYMHLVYKMYTNVRPSKICNQTNCNVLKHWQQMTVYFYQKLRKKKTLFLWKNNIETKMHKTMKKKGNSASALILNNRCIHGVCFFLFRDQTLKPNKIFVLTFNKLITRFQTVLKLQWDKSMCW